MKVGFVFSHVSFIYCCYIFWHNVFDYNSDKLHYLHQTHLVPLPRSHLRFAPFLVFYLLVQSLQRLLLSPGALLAGEVWLLGVEREETEICLSKREVK